MVWELRKDAYGVMVFINGNRAAFKPDSGKSGFFGAVMDVEVHDGPNLGTVQLTFAENSRSVRQLDDFKDSLGLKKTMSAEEFVEGLNGQLEKLVEEGISDNEATLGEDAQEMSVTEQSGLSEPGDEYLAGTSTAEAKKKKKRNYQDVLDADEETQLQDDDGPKKKSLKKHKKRDDEGTQQQDDGRQKNKSQKTHKKQTKRDDEGTQLQDDGRQKNKSQKTHKKQTKHKNVEPLPRNSLPNKIQEIDEKIEKKCKGEYHVPVACLIEPSEEMMLREVNPAFVKSIVDSYNPQLGFCASVFPVLVRGKFDRQRPENGKFQTLGGNHLRVAYKQLHDLGKIDIDEQMVKVKVYRKLTSLEGLRVASAHNIASHNTKPESFWQKVTVARKLLYKIYDLEESEDVPQGQSRDGRKKMWKEEFGTAMGEKCLSKEKLSKYGTIFTTASLSVANFMLAEEISEEDPNVGAGVFRCLHGLEEDDIHSLLQMKHAGEFKNSVEMAKEGIRRKKLAELKRKLPQLLKQSSWESTVTQFPMLTDDALHSYLTLDWEKNLPPPSIRSLCQKLLEGGGEIALNSLVFNGAKLEIMDVENIGEPTTYVVEVNEMSEELVLHPNQMVVTNFDTVGHVLNKLHDSTVHCLHIGDQLVPIVTSPACSAKVITGDSVEEGLIELLKKTNPSERIFCKNKDFALAALQANINVICDEVSSGLIRDHAITFLHNKNRKGMEGMEEEKEDEEESDKE